MTNLHKQLGISLTAAACISASCSSPVFIFAEDDSATSSTSTQGVSSTSADTRVSEPSTSTGLEAADTTTSVGTTTGFDTMANSSESTAATTSETSSTGFSSSDTGSNSSDTASTSDTGTSNAAPIAIDDGPYVVSSDEVFEAGEVLGVLYNDLDPDGDTIEVIGYDMASVNGGTIAMIANGSFLYTPPPSLPFGSDEFTYTIADENGATDTARVRVVIQPADSVLIPGGLGSKEVVLQGVDTGDSSGSAVGTAGDVDGDGYDDVLVGAQFADGAPNNVLSAGDAYLVHGGPWLSGSIALNDPSVVVYYGNSSSDNLGRSLSGVGDVNGDGMADILLGVPNEDPAGGANRGEGRLFYGDPGAAINVHLYGQVDNEHAGASVCGAGDFNGDGYSDILVGAPDADPGARTNAGETYLVFGKVPMPSITLNTAEYNFEGAGNLEYSGTSVSTAGDFNGDGFSDVLIGAPGTAAIQGYSYLVYGSPGTVPPGQNVVLSSANLRFNGASTDDASGRSVAAAGDVNGDGYGDILIGSHRAEVDDRGESYIVFGGPSIAGPNISLQDADVRLLGVDPGDESGWAVAGAGDFNGDGYDDILVGARLADPNGTSSGTVYLVLGGPNLPAVVNLEDADVRFEGMGFSQSLGESVSAAGDVNGDGFADILIGADGADPGGVSGAGETYLIFGGELDDQVTVLGTESDDLLQATNGMAADVVIGGRGNDVLESDGGSDVLRGGHGDDTLVVVDDLFLRVDGGYGFDTLELQGDNFTLNFTAGVSRHVRDIERIQMSSSGTSDLVLSETDIVNLSRTSNTVEIYGDVDDEVTVTSGTWSGPVDDGGIDVYTSMTTAAVVRIDPIIGILFL